MSVCVGRHQTVLLFNVVQENRLETLFKGDNVKALIKRQIVKFGLLFLREISWFSVTKRSLENGFGFPQ